MHERQQNDTVGSIGNLLERHCNISFLVSGEVDYGFHAIMTFFWEASGSSFGQRLLYGTRDILALVVFSFFFDAQLMLNRHIGIQYMYMYGTLVRGAEIK